MSKPNDLGQWTGWNECPGTSLAVGIIAKTNILKLEGLGAYMPKTAKGPDSLADYRAAVGEETGLTDLLLVCEDNLRPPSQGNNQRLGHMYRSNEADCSKQTEPGYIRGVRMQWDKIKNPEFYHTMVHNFAIACTTDYDQDKLQERFLRLIPGDISAGSNETRLSPL